MSQPTDEQIKEFWELCGFKHHTYPELWRLGRLEIEGARWITPDGKAAIIDTPNIDLNNLFEYAVPKLDALFMSITPDRIEVKARIGNPLEASSWGLSDNKVLATAMFWAIWEVLHDN